MKPIKLGALPSSKCVFKDKTLQDLICYTKALPDRGMIDVFDCDQPELTEYLASRFYKVDARYTDFTLCLDSIKWHYDDDHGLMALWLIHSEDVRPQLITKHGATEIEEDDVIVFNSHKGHAWICNGVAVFVTATISRTAMKS